MNPPDLRAILTFSVDAAREAGALTLHYFRAGTSHELKADATPVTAADRGAEKLLRARIAAAFPDHGILGEEYGEQPGRVPARWILDPIDGTFSFIGGVPLYSVLIGFEWQGEMLAGVIHLPALDETLYAARGLGCWWSQPGERGLMSGRPGDTDAAAGRPQDAAAASGRPDTPAATSRAPRPSALSCGAPTSSDVLIAPPLAPNDVCAQTVRRARVSDVSELSQARLSATSVKLLERAGKLAAYERLRRACLADRGWPDAYAYALLATGRVDVVLDPVMAIWDNAALLPIVTEAGGTFTDWSGRPTHTAPEALATNGKLLESTLSLLRT